MKVVYAGGGLGDVARRFYLTDTYELLGSFTEPTVALCFSHNPATLDFFRFHPNSKNILIMDLGHIYMRVLKDGIVPKAELKKYLFALCGFVDADSVAKPRCPISIGEFYAPDGISHASGHIVMHPFGRGWGDWPEHVCKAASDAIRLCAPTRKVYVICADYITSDGLRRCEHFHTQTPNIEILRNLSAPAAFSLVASASGFIGSMSALAQVAAFEHIPSLVLHPPRCTPFLPPFGDYARTIWSANGVSMAYNRAHWGGCPRL